MKKTNKEAMINFHLFIKFGEKKYIKKLFEEGELFLNTVDYYTKQENKEIGDSWEDVVWTEPITDFKSRVNNTVITAPSGSLQIHEQNLSQNLYCLWSLDDNRAIDNMNKEDNSLIIDTNNYNDFVNDGQDCYVVITNLEEFIIRIKKELDKRHLKCNMGPVKYFDERTYKGKVDPFMKRNKYEKQNEFRIIVDNKDNSPLKINIGNMFDIAQYFEENLEFKMGFAVNSEELQE